MGRQSKKNSPKTDIVLWGATSFVGQLLTDYLWTRYGETDKIRFALGGRSSSKLKALHSRLKADERLSLIVGDASDAGFLDSLAQNANLIVSTVGPYAKYGSPLVGACAEYGTDYCDLTGETQWMHRMIDAHQKDAEASGARIVHSCGFDSIPSDLGVLFLQNEALKRFGRPLNRVKLRVKAMRGGASGGTVASILNVIEEVRRNSNVAKIVKNPYALAPKGMRSGIRQPNVTTLEYDKDVQNWIGPFMMAAVNTRIVHRSNALLDYAWGRDFKYDEAMMMGEGFKGAIRGISVAGGLSAFLLGAAFSPTRFLMNKTLLPKPGEGPTTEQQEKGFYKLLIMGKGPGGNRLQVMVTGDRDPGYGSTCKMLGEAAVCLSKDITQKELKGGFWTPATAMGKKLIKRLKAHAGVTFDVVREK